MVTDRRRIRLLSPARTATIKTRNDWDGVLLRKKSYKKQRDYFKLKTIVHARNPKRGIHNRSKHSRICVILQVWEEILTGLSIFLHKKERTK